MDATTATAVAGPIVRFARLACMGLVATAFASQTLRAFNTKTPTITRVNAASSDPSTDSSHQLNVFEQPLTQCSTSGPTTGYYRDGFCKTDANDHGSHTVCSSVTDEFLEFSRSQGNDLISPHGISFPGLRSGDRWCLCSSRWKEAQLAGKAPPVNLTATHRNALNVVELPTLQEYAATAPDL